MSNRVFETDESRRYESVVELLWQPGAYAERPVKVECIETHISWVFLTDRFAYKLKKPVRFDFLDFSTSRCLCSNLLALIGRSSRKR